jgi:NAD(P)-dependent dehydrogenase (short-subunit alcohol dehydrogenase family)
MNHKSYVITGGTTGLGMHLAKTLTESGDRVLILARNKSNFDEVEKLLTEKRVTSKFVSVDFEKASLNENLIIDSINDFGTVDVLINNIGASLKMDLSCTGEDLIKVLQINLISTHILTQAVIKSMKKRNLGKIISISSMAAFNLDGLTPYVVAKGALDLYIRKSAMELSSSGIVHVGIRPGPVNVPGRYLTNLEINSPMEFIKWSEDHKYLPKSLCTMAEIDELIRFIVKSDGTFINGAIINLSGGTF